MVKREPSDVHQGWEGLAARRYRLSRKNGDKEMLVVFEALKMGWDTSRDIAEETGVPIAHVSYWLGQLVQMGMAKITYRNYGSWREDQSGRKFHRYAAIERS